MVSDKKMISLNENFKNTKDKEAKIMLKEPPIIKPQFLNDKEMTMMKKRTPKLYEYIKN